MSASIDRLLREHSGVVIASLVARFRDIDLAEEAFAEAVLAAVETWPESGVPDRPGAWLQTTARRRAIDSLRRAKTRARAQESGMIESELYAEKDSAAQGQEADFDAPIVDERLRLVFTCCHPALPIESRVALTLRLLGGLTTAQVAKAFLVPEPTMAKRLVRAKKKIHAARIPYRVPVAEELPARLEAVLVVIYLVFNQGWSEPAKGGELVGDAIRLGRVLNELMPGEPEVGGLLALMLLGHARRDARLVDGVFFPLDRQDPERWHWGEIREGLAILSHALRGDRLGPLQIQASISAKHLERAERGETPWDEIAELYETLEALDSRPIVALNAIVARANVEGSDWAIEQLERQWKQRFPELVDYQPWHAARAHLFARVGRESESREAYRRAIEAAPGEAERGFLRAEMDALGDAEEA